MSIIRDIILYAISVLLGVITVGGFMTSIPAGVLFLLATLLCLPATHSLLRKLTGNKAGKGIFALIGFLLALVLAFAGGMLAANKERAEEETKSNAKTAGSISTIHMSVVEDDSTQRNDVGENDSVQSDDAGKDALTDTEDKSDTEKKISQETTNDIPEPSRLEVHFLDVGQGDATLIKCGGQYMLIDAGDDTKGTVIWNYLRKQGVETLDYLILTHPDSDHIGGAPVVLTKFDVNHVFVSNYKKDTTAYHKLIQALDDQLIEAATPNTGSTYNLGNATFQILAPVNTYNNANDSSIALMVTHGENTFLFTGDAEIQAEADMLVNGNSVDADVYQVGHHGSSSSSSSNFLNAVSPAYAVISCEEGNSYGHPHAEVLNNLRTMDVDVFRTDEQGSIVATSDGKEITWNCAPTTSWQAGERTLSGGRDDDEGDTDELVEAESDSEKTDYDGEYILNTNTMKFHLPDCASVDEMAEENKETSKLSREEIMEDGYEACQNCNP
ncbi:MAG: MBL fold metallo-hydrolase [Lachnospiraceae bacterium]|nr:MBL fold metallo-hydrolase [Lachnospiraceae bacterium]